MIITHSNKFLIPKSKVIGGLFNLTLDIPDIFISSNCVNKSKKYWANPISAAYLPEAKKITAEANLNGVEKSNFPNFVDSYTKQLFLKTNNGYIVHSPLTSCALVDEFTTKAFEFHNLLLKKYQMYKELINTKKYIEAKKFFGSGYFIHQIQSPGVTLANRGELATKHGGKFFIKVAPFIGTFKLNRKVNLDNDKKYLYFYGSVDGANLNSGFISSGLPAISAIGGMIESIELKLNYDDPIPFAFGLKNHNMQKGGKLGNSINTKQGRKVIPNTVLEEKIGSFDFVIILDVTNFNYNDIANELLKIKRLAGGVIFNYKVSDSLDDNDYFYVRKFTRKMKAAVNSGDVIDYVIKHRFHPLACGYAMLEKPNEKEGVRLDSVNNEKYHHSFSETLFLPIRMTKKLDNKSFFKREIFKNCTAYI